MIATKAYVTKLQQTSRMTIDDRLEAYILAEYGEEPFPNTWSEQDLNEQIRKLVVVYNTGKLEVSVKTPYQRLQKNHEALKQVYIDLIYETVDLVEKLRDTRIEVPTSVLQAKLPFD